MLILRALAACALLCAVVSGLDSIRPDSSVPSNLQAEFGCALGSSSSILGVYSTSSSQDSGAPAWGLFPFQQRSDKTWTRQQSLLGPSPSSSKPSSFGDQCFMDLYGNYAVIGEPWANSGTGRVLLYKSNALANSWSAPELLGEGNMNTDKFGSDVAIFGEWLVASAPRASDPYVRIYKSAQQGFTIHSELNSSGLGFDVRQTVFGAWIDLRSQWLVVGAPSDESIGKVYIFKFVDSENKWALFQTLQAPTSGNQGGDLKSFGSVVSIRTNRLFVSAPGSSTASGTVYKYSFNAHDEWSIVEILKSPNRLNADEFGRFISATDSTLAISEGPQPTRPYPRVHTYQQCGTHQMALRTAIEPDEADRSNGRWGRRLAWNGNALLIGSTGLVNVWHPASSTGCRSALGPFPAPSCCYDGANVIVSSSGLDGKIVISGQETTTPVWIDGPIRVEGSLEISGTNVLALKNGASIQVAGQVSLAGKLKVQFVRPVNMDDGKSESFNVDNLIVYDSKIGSFSEIEAEFENGAQHCDKFTIRPYYNPNSLGLIVDFTLKSKDCKASSSNPLLAVYITLGILALLIVVTAIAVWRVPALREIVFRPRQARSGYSHARLLGVDEDDDEDGRTHSFQSFPADQDMTLGVESGSDEDEDNDKFRS